MRVRSTLFALLAVLVAAGTASAHQARAGAPASQRLLAGTGPLGAGGWSWFGDPRAVFHAGRRRQTYVGWIGRRGQVVVSSIDHDTGARVSRVLRRGFAVDDHNNPSLLVRPDGRIEAFYSGHNGPAMYHRTTVRPEDVRRWGPERRLRSNTRGPRGYTYPNPVRLAAERRTYLFWRGGNWSPTFATRPDGGRWSRARQFLRPPRGHARGTGYRRPYVKVASDGVSTIAFAFTEDHPGARPTTIRYAAYRDGALWRADGRRLATIDRLPLRVTRAERVADERGRGDRLWLDDVALDAAGRPVVLFVVLRTKRDHRYRYARWTGERWEVHELGETGVIVAGPGRQYYTPGAVLDHTDPSIVYVTRRPGRRAELERWRTFDGGATWRREAVTRDSPTHNLRPFSPRNHPPGELDVLWMRGPYAGFLDFRTWIVGPARAGQAPSARP